MDLDLPAIKYHMQELSNLFDQDLNSTRFGQIHCDLDALLNSHPLSGIPPKSDPEKE